MRLTWSSTKARGNRRKHGVSFEEAAGAFGDPNGLMIDDPDHSTEEARFVLLGLSSRLRLLVVCHALRGGGDEARIISARRATRSEQRTYFERGRS